jgi:hypothetical protein
MNCVPASRFFAFALLAASLAAQKFPLADAPGREAALVDVSALLPKPKESQEPDIDRMRAALAELAAFVREFCEPAFGPLHDVQPAGERWLLVLGEWRQVAFVEHLVATARANPQTTLSIETRFYMMPKAQLEQHIEPLLPKVEAASASVPVLKDVPVVGFLFQQDKGRAGSARVAVVEAEKAKTMNEALAAADGVDLLIAPRLQLLPMHAASLRAGEDVAYRKDYECTVVDGAFVWNEVRDVVFDGVRMGATCGLLEGDRIALKLAVSVQDVVRPIAEFQTTLEAKAPGKGEQKKTVTIELPHVTGIETAQSLVLKDGASALVVGDQGDGTFCVAVVSVQKQ